MNNYRRFFDLAGVAQSPKTDSLTWDSPPQEMISGDAIFISIDLEMLCFNKKGEEKLLTELGISWLDPRDLHGVKPEDRGMHCRPYIQDAHFVIKENMRYGHGLTRKPCPFTTWHKGDMRNTLFCKSRRVSKHDVAEIVVNHIRNLVGLEKIVLSKAESEKATIAPEPQSTLMPTRDTTPGGKLELSPMPASDPRLKPNRGKPHVQHEHHDQPPPMKFGTRNSFAALFELEETDSSSNDDQGSSHGEASSRSTLPRTTQNTSSSLSSVILSSAPKAVPIPTINPNSVPKSKSTPGSTFTLNATESQPATNPRKIFFIFHDPHGDLKTLRANGIWLTQQFPNRAFIDTQKHSIYNCHAKRSQPRPEELLNGAGILSLELHNGSNDARFTLEAFLAMAFMTESQEEAFGRAFDNVLFKWLPPSWSPEAREAHRVQFRILRAVRDGTATSLLNYIISEPKMSQAERKKRFARKQDQA